MSRRGSGQGYRTRICSLTHTHLYIASSTRGPVTVLLTTSSSCMMMSEPGGVRQKHHHWGSLHFLLGISWTFEVPPWVLLASTQAPSLFIQQPEGGFENTHQISPHPS